MDGNPTLATGDYVSWTSRDGISRGRIARVVRYGIAESGDGFEVMGLASDPAAEVVAYEESPDGWRATEVVVAHKFSRLTKIEPLTTGDQRMAVTDLDRLDIVDEVRAIEDENGETWIEGYGIVFDELSEDLGGFRERITRGAVEPIISSGAEIRSYFNHDDNQMLGTTANGSLRLIVDARGVKYSVKPPKTRAGMDAVELVRNQYIKGSSFRFKTAPGGDSWAMEGRESIRTVGKMTYIREIGPVVEPAYRGTSAAIRSLEEWQQSDPNQIAKAKLRLKELGTQIEG